MSDLLLKALRNIAEGNLGDDPWQADYTKIRATAQAAIDEHEAIDASSRFGKALSELPHLAAAAGRFVGVTVTDAKGGAK